MGQTRSLLWMVVGMLLSACGTTAASPGLATSPDAENGLVERAVEAFLRSYFSSWSSGDMAAYRAHFDANAAVFLVREGAMAARLPLESFFAQQARAQADPATRAVERMETWEAHADGQAASATVRWVLEAFDGSRVRGVDRFLLVRFPEGAWKIVSLVFYATDSASPATRPRP